MFQPRQIFVFDLHVRRCRYATGDENYQGISHQPNAAAIQAETAPSIAFMVARDRPNHEERHAAASLP
jgi:hypothetical protein